LPSLHNNCAIESRLDLGHVSGIRRKFLR